MTKYLKYSIIILLYSSTTTHAQNPLNASLSSAVVRGNLTEARSLLEKGANVDEVDKYFGAPLMIAVLNNDNKMVQLILEYKPNAHIKRKNGDTVLHEAVSQINSQMMVHLLNYDPTLINKRNKQGQTAAYYTVHDRTLDMIQVLEYYATSIGEYKALFSIQDARGNSLLHRAVKASNLPLTKRLIAKGINVKLKNYKGNTAIHFTFNNTKPDIAQFLLDNGANINEQNNFKSTPIFMSIVRDNLPLTLFYIEQGANLLQKNNANTSPLELAYQRSHRSHRKIHYSKHESRIRHNIYKTIKNQVEKDNPCSTSFQPN